MEAVENVKSQVPNYAARYHKAPDIIYLAMHEPIWAAIAALKGEGT